MGDGERVRRAAAKQPGIFMNYLYKDVIIANRGVPAARLLPFQEQRTRPLGFVKGGLPECFFDVLPEEELREWEL